VQEKNISTVRLAVTTDTITGPVEHALTLDAGQEKPARAPQLTLAIGPSEEGKIDFTAEGWSRVNGLEPDSSETVGVRYLKLKPSEMVRVCGI